MVFVLSTRFASGVVKWLSLVLCVELWHEWSVFLLSVLPMGKRGSGGGHEIGMPEHQDSLVSACVRLPQLEWPYRIRNCGHFEYGR